MKKKRVKLYVLLLVLALTLVGYIYQLLKDDEREPYAVDIYLINKGFSATAELIIFDEEGRDQSCTAFAYQKNENRYRFFTASHCVTRQIYMDDHELNIVGDNSYVIILRSPITGGKSSYFARLVNVDRNSEIGDFAILEAEIDVVVEPLVFSNNAASSGECVFNISYPRVYLGNVFYGYVATNKNPFAKWLYPNRAFRNRFESISDASGASGSAVLRCLTGEVIGIAVEQNQHSVIVQPVSHLVEFLAEVDKGNFLVQKQP